METLGRDLLQAVFGTGPYFLPAKRSKPADEFAEKQLLGLELKTLEVLLINENAVNENVSLADIFENLIDNTSVKTIKLYNSDASNRFIKTLKGTQALENAENLNSIEIFYCDEEPISDILELFNLYSLIGHHLSSLEINLLENQREPISSYCVRVLTTFLQKGEGERLHKLSLKAPMNTRDIFNFMEVVKMDKNLQTLEFEPIFISAMSDDEKERYDHLKEQIDRRMRLNRNARRIPIKRKEDEYILDDYFVEGKDEEEAALAERELREYLKNKEEENKIGQERLEHILKHGFLEQTQLPRPRRSPEDEIRRHAYLKFDIFLDGQMEMDEFIEYSKEVRRKLKELKDAPGAMGMSSSPRLLPVRRKNPTPPGAMGGQDVPRP